MNYTDIIYLIEKNTDKVEFADFGDGVSQQWIDLAESRLGVVFPPSYVWWLKNYSGGQINGNEIFSIYEVDFDEVVGGDIVYINELNQKKKEMIILEKKIENFEKEKEKLIEDTKLLVYNKLNLATEEIKSIISDQCNHNNKMME